MQGCARLLVGIGNAARLANTLHRRSLGGFRLPALAPPRPARTWERTPSTAVGHHTPRVRLNERRVPYPADPAQASGEASARRLQRRRPKPRNSPCYARHGDACAMEHDACYTRNVTSAARPNKKRGGCDESTTPGVCHRRGLRRRTGSYAGMRGGKGREGNECKRTRRIARGSCACISASRCAMLCACGPQATCDDRCSPRVNGTVTTRE
jgi:hypothetical protein